MTYGGESVSQRHIATSHPITILLNVQIEALFSLHKVPYIPRLSQEDRSVECLRHARKPCISLRTANLNVEVTNYAFLPH
jgi:hypothetical protein